MKDLDRCYYVTKWVRWPNIYVCEKYYKHHKQNEKIIDGINVSYIKLFFKQNKDTYTLTNDGLIYFDINAKTKHRKICKWDPNKWQIETFNIGMGEIMLILKQKI